jgi:hypothetical protein
MLTTVGMRASPAIVAVGLRCSPVPEGWCGGLRTRRERVASGPVHRKNFNLCAVRLISLPSLVNGVCLQRQFTTLRPAVAGLGSCDALDTVARAARRSRRHDHWWRKVAAISLATLRARTISPGPSEMAATRACPPPPYFSHSDARFTSAEASFQGLVPTEIFDRAGEALTPTV